MQGIQSLMPGQAQQAPLPGMMPQQSSSTPSAMTGSLKNMPMEQLKMLFLNPQPGSPPLWAVISALAEKQKEAQAIQAAMGQGAMAQNAQMQQQPPVAAQVMQAAEGGIMQGYAGGGAVAFNKGGNPQQEQDRQRIISALESAGLGVQKLAAAGYDVMSMPVRALAGIYNTLARGPRAFDVNLPFIEDFGTESMTPAMDAVRAKEMRRASLMSSPEAQAMVSRYGQESRGRTFDPVMSPEAQAQTNRQGPSGNMAADKPRVAQPTATTFDITNPASINALRMAAQDTSLPEAERADLQRRIAMMEGNRPAQSGVASLAKPQANLTPEEEQYFANKASTLRTRQGLPEDVLAGRQGIATLAAENLAAQRAEREQMAREAKEQRDAALAKAQRGIMDDPMSLLALAGSIDTRRGQSIGSLARGAAGLMGKREEQAEAARKEFALAQRDQRMLQANERQANMLELQRQQAIRENELPRVAQIEDQLAALEVQKSQLLRSRQEHAEKMALEGLKVDVMKAEAAAKLGRPTEIDFYREDPVGYGKFQAARRGPQTAGDRQDLNELKALQGNLQKQIENYALPKGVRDAAAAQLQQVNAKLAQMAGLDGTASASNANDPLGIRK